MSETKTFRSPPPPIDAPPITFGIAVHRARKDDEGKPVINDDGHPVYDEDEQQFTAKGFVSGGLLAQVELITGHNPGEHARGGDAIYDFYYGALLPDDVVRFRALLEAPDVYVHSSVLSDIAVWLYEQYTDRPTKQA